VYPDLKGGNEGDSKLFVDHKGKDSHLGGTTLVEFDGTLLQLGFLCKMEKKPPSVRDLVDWNLVCREAAYDTT
jgi:hypothetical protein